MPERVDTRHLRALLGVAGKAIASQPGASQMVARMKLASSAEDFAYLLQNLDLGVDAPAREIIWQAATDRGTWRETHATLVRSAEQQLIERFSPSS